MSDSFLSDYLRTRSRVDQLERIESGGGEGVYITLTRTSTLTVTTAGTVITWQSEVWNSGFTWSGPTITIPMDGYYLIDMAFEFGGSKITYIPNINVNLENVGLLIPYSGGSNRERMIAMRHFTAFDEVQIRIVAAANRNMLVNPYDFLSESPFLHIAKVS